MVQSEFNFVFWFVSYNIFLLQEQSGTHTLSPLSHSLACRYAGASLSYAGMQALIAHVLYPARNSGCTLVPDHLQNTGAAVFVL
jgi:hypothetical protein